MATYLMVRDSDGYCVNAIVLDDPATYVPQDGMTLYPHEGAGAAWIGYILTDEGWASPQPYPSWTLHGTEWQAPKPMPTEDGPWAWDEATLDWVEDE